VSCITLRQVLITDRQLGKEADVVFQICRRWVTSSEVQPPAITSAFARSSIPGHVFIEAFNIANVRRAVDGLATVRDKQAVFIAPTEYVGILSRCPHPSSRIENGQWVCCLAGKYRGDVGYVCESIFPMYEWCALVAFVPRIPQSGGKRKRDRRPAPRVWTTEELIQQYGERRVKILGSGQLRFRGCLYQDGLAFELVPLTLLRVLQRSPRDITPFLQSGRIRTLPAFAASLQHFAQDSIQVGDRILVVSGEHNGIIGRIRDIRDDVADVVTQIPEKHSGLIICVTLRDLIPYFLAGDYVKIHWLSHCGLIIAVEHDTRIVTFLDEKTNTEVCPHLPLPFVVIDL
jgi:transcription elongation factor SPT5